MRDCRLRKNQETVRGGGEQGDGDEEQSSERTKQTRKIGELRL
jgi:hypothetical protein